MGSAKSKAKRKAELAKRARQRQQRKGIVPTSTVAVDRAQAAWDLKPKAFANEPVHDVAVFARSSRDQLPEDLQTQATAVAEALELVRHGDDQRPLEMLKEIPRSSPYADWRLLVRGLISFYQGDVAAAQAAWSRLDPQRRPARIAAALLKAENDSASSPDKLSPDKLSPDKPGPPAKLVDAAKLLRHRPHILAAARAIINLKPTSHDANFSVAQARELIQFRHNYRSHDPDFVNRFAQACVKCTIGQSDYDVFELLIGQIPGPAEDPHWNLESFKYNCIFDDAEEEADEAVERYIAQDLPLTSLAQPVKSALASRLRLAQARLRYQTSLGPYGDLPSERKVRIETEKLLRQAIKDYPANRAAHSELVNLIEEELNQRGITAADTKKITQRIASCKAALVEAFPEEVEATLWLIDYYFDEDQLTAANQLVEQLASYRLNDPRTKALPWKLKVREAMRDSRLKKRLGEAYAALDAAREKWPSWLSQTWLPFLHAALKLREGDRPQFAQLIAAAVSAGQVSPVVADLMTFAALQQMNLPSKELKPFRDLAEGHIAKAASLPLPDLLAIGNFFWDLTRSGLRHKAYRLQASKLCKAVVKRLMNDKVKPDACFEGAVLWMAAHDFGISFGSSVPKWLLPHLDNNPRIAAATVDWVMRCQYFHQPTVVLQKFVESILQAAEVETDPYYRLFMNRVATEAAERIAEWERVSGYFDDRQDEDEDEGEDEEDECDCAECQARRARAAAAGGGPQRNAYDGIDLDYFDDDDDDDDYDDTYSDFADNLSGFLDGGDDRSLAGSPELEFVETLISIEGGIPPSMMRVLAKLHARPLAKFNIGETLSELTQLAIDNGDAATMEPLWHKVVDELQACDVTFEDAVEFISINLRVSYHFAKDRVNAETATAPNPTAEERRRSRKQRQKELNRRKR